MAADPKRIAGIAYITVNGKQLALKGDLVVNFSKRKREGIAGQDGVHGYSEMPKIPSIKGKVSKVAGLSMDEVDNWTDVTCVVEGANGQTVAVGRNGWSVSDNELNTQSGDFDLELQFMDGEWQS